MMAVRTLGAAALLLAYLVWRLGATRARGRAARRLAALPRARRAQRGAAVLADRVGRAAHRLRARGRAAGVGADLQRAARCSSFVPHERLTADARARARARSASASRSSRASTRTGAAGAIVGALAVVAVVALLRGRRRLRPARGLRHAPGRCSPPGSMLAGGLILLPLALFQLPEQRAGLEAVGVAPRPHVAGTALAQLLLFRMLAPARLVAALPRHVSDARLRARLRRAASSTRRSRAGRSAASR